MERVLSVLIDFRAYYNRVRPALGDGSSFLIGAHVTQTFLRFASNLVLTRLLAPEDYGVVGIMISVAYILQLVSDMGLRTYVIRHEHARDELLQSVWTIRLIRNLIISVIMFFGAGFMASLYDAPQVTMAIRVYSFIFILEALTSMSPYVTERARGVIRMTVVEFARFLLTTISAIIAAYFLRNYWAIVWSMFVGQFFMLFAAYFFLEGPPIRLRLEKEHFKDLWNYWRIIIPASLITIVLSQTNTFVMANYFPISELGKFALAMTIATAVVTLTQEFVVRVFFPAFAEANRKAPETAAAVFYDARRWVTMLLAFGLGGLIGGAELLVRILFNDLYLGAGVYLALLCIKPLALLATFPAEQAIIAKGFIKISLISNVLRFIWILIAGPIAYLQYGPFAVVVVLCLADAAVIPFFWLQQRRFGLLKVREELIIPVCALAGGAIGYACYSVVETLIAAGRIPSF